MAPDKAMKLMRINSEQARAVMCIACRSVQVVAHSLKPDVCQCGGNTFRTLLPEHLFELSLSRQDYTLMRSMRIKP